MRNLLVLKVIASELLLVFSCMHLTQYATMLVHCWLVSWLVSWFVCWYHILFFHCIFSSFCITASVQSLTDNSLVYLALLYKQF